MDSITIDASKFATELYTDVDRMDAHAFASRFASDGKMYFANADAVEGREAIESVIVAIFGTLRGIQHELLGVWSEDEAIFCDITVTRKDGVSISLPSSTLTKLDADGNISLYRIYIDQAPLFALTARSSARPRRGRRRARCGVRVSRCQGPIGSTSCRSCAASWAERA